MQSFRNLRRVVNRNDPVGEAVWNLASALQVEITPERVRHYTRVLRKFDVQDVQSALLDVAGKANGRPRAALPHAYLLAEYIRDAERKRLSPMRFIPCGRCFNGRTYVDANGHPCDVTASPNRTMMDCRCKVEWQRSRNAESVAARSGLCGVSPSGPPPGGGSNL